MLLKGKMSGGVLYELREEGRWYVIYMGGRIWKQDHNRDFMIREFDKIW